MNYSSAVFLINKNIRAISCSYEPEESKGKNYTFKSLDPTIKVGDLVVVQTDTRHKFTVVKVEAVDVDIDLDSSIQFKWIVSKVDLAAFDILLAQEADAIKTIRSAELRQKRDNLRKAMFANYEAELSALSIADMNGKPEQPAIESQPAIPDGDPIPF